MDTDENIRSETPKKGIRASRPTSPEPLAEPPFLAPIETGSQTERTEQTATEEGEQQTWTQTSLDQANVVAPQTRRKPSPLKGVKRPDQALRMLGNTRGRGNKGNHLSEETKRKIAARMIGNRYGEYNRGIPKSDEWKRKASLAKMGDRNPMRNPVHARKMAATKKGKPNPKLKEFWRVNHDEQIRRMMVGEHKKPNKLEKRLIELVRLNGLPFKYVGNWKLVVAGKCPDFVHSKGMKLLIELVGDYWHTVKARETAEQRVERFRKHGYETLVIWQKEMQDEKAVVMKIRRFCGLS